MRVAFAILLILHGAIHGMGFVKAFGLADVAQLHQPISRPLGALWLLAGLAFVAGAVLLLSSSPAWWVAAAPALVVSQILIALSWSDAKFGTVANAIVLVPLALSLLDLRESSFRSLYRRQVDQSLSRAASAALVTEADLAPLPPLVQGYLRRAGVVGRPHVHDFRARFRGEIRRTTTAGWMAFRAEQHNFFDEPSRFFLMEASLYGIPFDGLHIYVGPSATMQVRVASLVDVVDARGPEMNRSETVTLFNDMCILAPGSLVDARVAWKQTGDHTVSASFTNAGNTIGAELTFDAEGDLVGFVSRDRYLSADGKTYTLYPWSTPVRDYRDFGGVRIAARGDAIWLRPEGDFTYGRFELEEIQYNVGRR